MKSIKSSSLYCEQFEDITKRIVKEQKASISMVQRLFKVTIPKERERLKELLTFLSEKIYKGPLTGKTMISNSTRLKEEEKTDT